MRIQAKSIFTFIFLLGLMSCGPQSDVVTGQLSRNIVGGKEVLKGSDLAKNQVFIVLENAEGIPETCTGSFISKHHILTAAHCISPDHSSMSLYSGTRPILQKSRDQLTIAHIFVHPRYNPNSKLRNDLALIEIKEEFKYPSTILALPNSQHELDIELTLQAAGYGRTDGIEDSETGADSVGVLRRTNILGFSIKNNKIIVDQKNGKGVCFGDSGGPLIAKIGKVSYIVGVASAVYDDSELAESSTGAQDSCTKKSMFMEVKYYLRWINKIINPEFV